MLILGRMPKQNGFGTGSDLRRHIPIHSAGAKGAGPGVGTQKGPWMAPELSVSSSFPSPALGLGHVDADA